MQRLENVKIISNHALQEVNLKVESTPRAVRQVEKSTSI